MESAFYATNARIEKVEGVHRRAHLEPGVTIEIGVHGPIKTHYRLNDRKNLPLPVDYLAAATGAWMLGTLNGALEVRGLDLPAEAIHAEARGYNELREGIPVLTRVHVHYTLRIPAGTREVVDRALARHRDKCPTAVSLSPAIEVSWTADIEETGWS